MFQSLKRLVIGRPIATADEGHQRLRKKIALPVFASDAISSTAYATDEILVVLLASAGQAASSVSAPRRGARSSRSRSSSASCWSSSSPATARRSTPTRAAAAATSSAKENLGTIPSLIAGSSLLVDYILTVAVSVAGGVLAIRTATGLGHKWTVPDLPALRARDDGRQPARPEGVRRAVRRADVLLHRDAAAADRHRLLPHLRAARRPDPRQHALRGGQARQQGTSEQLGLFMLLRAFSSGAVALSGVEAVSQRRARVQEAGGEERGEHAGVDGRHPRHAASSA